jgi:phage I-like protein
MSNFRSTPIKFSDALLPKGEEIKKDIQVLRVGEFTHNGQRFSIKQKHLSDMVNNFHEGVRGIDLMLDFSHKSEGKAAAWFKDLYLSEDGKELWAKVDWTDSGEDSVRKKEFKYISADFTFSHTDNETQKKMGPVLYGAGLTNRPVVKNMQPVVLSELNNSGEKMDDKKELEELKAKNKELMEQIAAFKKGDKEKELSEREAKLAEKEEAIKLSEEKAAKEKAEAEKKGKFDALLSEGKVVEAQREAYMADDMVKFSENAVDPKTLNFSETGTSGTGNSNKYDKSETPAQDEVLELAEKQEKDISVILSENPALNKRYQEEIGL